VKKKRSFQKKEEGEKVFTELDLPRKEVNGQMLRGKNLCVGGGIASLKEGRGEGLEALLFRGMR